MEKQLDREMLEALVEAQGKIDKLEFMEMLEFLVGQIIKILKEKIRCSIFRVFPESETLCLLAGDSNGEHGIGMKFNFSDLEALREVVETKSWLIIADPRQDPRTEKTHQLFHLKDVNTVLLIPLLAEDEVIGIIAIDAMGGRKGFTEEELYYCLTLSNLAGLLLERDMMKKEKAERETLIMLGQAAAEAAHRLKNPLTVIGGYARRLVKIDNSRKPLKVIVNFIRRLVGLNDSRRKNYAGRIVDGVMELEKIVNDLLRLSRQKRTKLLEININEAVIETKKLFKPISEKDIKFDFKLNPGLPVILGDPLDMEELFSVIFRNAAEAIQKEGKIFVKTKHKDGWIKISISNTGGCIDKEAMQEIFNPFFTTKPDATGMGLATAASIIRAYGGEIRVENDKDLKLATFIVKLPIG